MDRPLHQRGVSLIEVLMAVLIFSIGLIGLAGLLVMASRSNQAAYLRTQATFLASNMADRMRANSAGVWNGRYDASYPVTSGSTICDKVTPCDAAAVATRDRVLWSSLMTALLPEATAAIRCSRASAGYDPSAQIGFRPPYGGNCTMKITWAERRAGDSEHRETAPQIFAWEFQP